MENKVRSQRSREAAIAAALAVIVRDGPGRLTLDAIARESGISKGGLLHQFRSKTEVIRALLDHQMRSSAEFDATYAAGLEPGHPEVALAGQIAALRAAAAAPSPVTFAILSAMAEDPKLLSCVRETNLARMERIWQEASDPDLATLRWAAAWGLLLMTLMNLSPVEDEARERLFDRLLDHRHWDTPVAAT